MSYAADKAAADECIRKADVLLAGLTKLVDTRDKRAPKSEVTAVAMTLAPIAAAYSAQATALITRCMLERQ